MNVQVTESHRYGNQRTWSWYLQYQTQIIKYDHEICNTEYKLQYMIMTFTKQNINWPLQNSGKLHFLHSSCTNKFRPHTSRYQWNSRMACTVTAVPVLHKHCIRPILNGLLLCFYYYIWWVKRCVLIVTVDQEVSTGMHLY